MLLLACAGISSRERANWPSSPSPWWFVALFQFAGCLSSQDRTELAGARATSAFFIGGWLFCCVRWCWVLARYARPGAIAAGLVSARRIIVLGEPELMPGQAFCQNLGALRLSRHV